LSGRLGHKLPAVLVPRDFQDLRKLGAHRCYEGVVEWRQSGTIKLATPDSAGSRRIDGTACHIQRRQEGKSRARPWSGGARGVAREGIGSLAAARSVGWNAPIARAQMTAEPIAGE
jgi:hypothetical protein